MKLLLQIIGLFLILNSSAQSPAGFANCITLGNSEGFPGYLYVNYQRAPSGKLYTNTYNGDVYINSNNQVKKIEKLSGLSGGTGTYYFPDTVNCWYYNSHRVIVLQGDSVIRTIPAPAEIFYHFVTSSGRLFYFDKKNDQTLLYEFTGHEFINRKSFSDLPITEAAQFVLDTHKNLWWFQNKDDHLKIYRFDEKEYHFTLIKSHPVQDPLLIRGLRDENDFLANKVSNGKIVYFRGGKPYFSNYGSSCGTADNICTNFTYYPYGVLNRERGQAEVVQLDWPEEKRIFQFQSTDPVTHMSHDSLTDSWYGNTNNKPVQVFSYIKLYPGVFGNHSSNIFSLTQDANDRIWAASYKGGIAVIDQNRVVNIFDKGYNFLNGSASLNTHQYLITDKNGMGLIQYDAGGNKQGLTQGVLGYYLYISRDKKYFYYGTSSYAGLWQAPLQSIEKARPVWNKIDSSKGVGIYNILTITEDSAGRIWCGHPKRGISVFNPATHQARTWLIEKKQSSFGAYASLTDPYGTVWIGSGDKGLWYYNDYSLPASPASCKPINHPLLTGGKAITAMAVYKDWLIVAATDKLLLLNLDSFHHKKIITLRYLNPRAAGFTSVTEQNSMLISRKDSTVWFSTGDMLYQWDFQRWLSVPNFRVNPEVQFSTAFTHSLNCDKRNYFKAGTENFDISVYYHSPDLLPRYIRTAFVRDGDDVTFSEASLENRFSFKNINSGHYTFHLEIFEADGSTSTLHYRIIIRKYLWQQWWFWALLALAATGIVVTLVSLRKQKQLAEQKALAKEAQLQTFKSEQEKKLAELQLISLSSQFRPHFILNALNTIGARMDNHPEAETVLSRLGESVNLIFNHASRQQILHPFPYEWKLVENIIDIHRLMYLKQLETTVPTLAELARIQTVNIPMGLLQIPVENALLHGLSNRLNSPWRLIITCTVRDSDIVFNITDNGIGRQKSATLSNYSKHGTGTKNLNETIAIINSMQKEKISISYQDGVYSDENGPYGTAVTIIIPKGLNYAG